MSWSAEFLWWGKMEQWILSGFCPRSIFQPETVFHPQHYQRVYLFTYLFISGPVSAVG
jgi:hypothetical protein